MTRLRELGGDLLPKVQGVLKGARTLESPAVMTRSHLIAHANFEVDIFEKVSRIRDSRHQKKKLASSCLAFQAGHRTLIISVTCVIPMPYIYRRESKNRMKSA